MVFLHFDTCIRHLTENFDEESKTHADDDERYSSDMSLPLDFEGKTRIVAVHLLGCFIHRPNPVVLVIIHALDLASTGLPCLPERATPFGSPEVCMHYTSGGCQKWVGVIPKTGNSESWHSRN